MLILEGIVMEGKEKDSRDASVKFFVTTERWCEKLPPSPPEDSSHVLQFQEPECLVPHL